MSSRKTRILHVGEAPYLSTGYSVYANEVLKRLVKSDKYEIAQLACYDNLDDPRRNSIPWKLYSNMPKVGEDKLYQAEVVNQFGAFRFNDVLLDFRPDIVFDIRDCFMFDFEERSPFRRLFNHCLMPTVDSVPQQEQWLASFADADAVLTYSDWGLKVLNSEGGGLIRTRGSAPPGVDTEVFRPFDKQDVRNSLGFDDSPMFIVGTCMRNQGRKLYPNLIADFAKFLDEAPEDISSKSYLYLHVSYPDVGWDIPNLIKNSGISDRILVTYKCQKCHAVVPNLYSDASLTCPACGSHRSMGLPNLKRGVDRATLAAIMNLFDVYVQYAVCEGFGVPQIEAAACGVPVFSVDYSAMEDVVRKVNGYPIKCSLQMEHSFGRYEAIPDQKDFVSQLIRFLTLSGKQRAERGYRARQGVLTHYTWERTTSKWMDVFDSLEAKNLWDSPPRLHTPRNPPGSFSTHEECVRWSIANVLGRPDLVNSYMALRLIRDLNWGVRVASTGGSYQNEECVLGTKNRHESFTPDDMIKELVLMCEESNRWEVKRCQLSS